MFRVKYTKKYMERQRQSIKDGSLCGIKPEELPRVEHISDTSALHGMIQGEIMEAKYVGPNFYP
jgi:hypothetical protein